MQTSLEAWREAFEVWVNDDGPQELCAGFAAAVIEAYAAEREAAARADERAKVVAEIVAEIYNTTGTFGPKAQVEDDMILWVGRHIEAKFTTPVMENPYHRSTGDE